jgi:anti-sigma regulatory factor (Ser/Thr protein kinase)
VPAAELELPAHPRNVGVARRFVRDTLAAWDADELSLVTELVVSELVSNSILHARTPLLLRLRTDGDRIVVEVADDSPVTPVRRHYDAEATTGRGLSLVASITDGDWGSRPTSKGKLVWARIPPGADLTNLVS